MQAQLSSMILAVGLLFATAPACAQSSTDSKTETAAAAVDTVVGDKWQQATAKMVMPATPPDECKGDRNRKATAKADGCTASACNSARQTAKLRLESQVAGVCKTFARADGTCTKGPGC